MKIMKWGELTEQFNEMPFTIRVETPIDHLKNYDQVIKDARDLHLIPYVPESLKAYVLNLSNKHTGFYFQADSEFTDEELRMRLDVFLNKRAGILPDEFALVACIYGVKSKKMLFEYVEHVITLRYKRGT